MLPEFDALIIDEVSLLSSNMIDAVSLGLQMYNENGAPFGGLQVVLIGTFCPYVYSTI